jgi:hypothetical protein
MNGHSRDGFYGLWTTEIILCLILSIFSVLLPSCTKAAASTGTERTNATAAVQDDALVPADTLYPDQPDTADWPL